jgi:DNA repair exonuclease SbcCD ATPase subunit
MKRINFTKLTIKNFLSVGNEQVTVNFKNGLNVITGFNRDEEDIKNGVGKSVILDAFYFAIFGNTMRELPKQFIINRKIGKGAVVRLEFEDISSKRGEEYFVIERTLGPAKCRVWKNDIEKTKSSIAETNKYILEVLDADEDVFQNCVMMRANSTVPFMGKKKTEKKNFIESIFNLGVFS